MKTKILMLLMIAIAIILIGTVDVEGYYASSAEELANFLGDATYSGNVVQLIDNVTFSGESLSIYSDLILDLNGFSLSRIEIQVHSNLYVKNGIFDVRLAYWKTLTVENATVRRIRRSSRIFYKC